MKTGLKIVAALVVLLAALAAAVYLGLIEPPPAVRKLPLVNRLVPPYAESGGASTKVSEVDLLREELREARAKVTSLENQKAELQTRIETLEKERDLLKEMNQNLAQEGVQYKKLAEYYSSMKAKKAAAIMAELDEETLVGILSNMGSETAAGIMSELDPQQAAVLTKRMLQAKGGE